MAPDLADHKEQRGPSHRRWRRPSVQESGDRQKEQTGSKILGLQNPSVAGEWTALFSPEGRIWNEAGKMDSLVTGSYRKREECPCPSNIPPPEHLYDQSLQCSENRRFLSEMFNQEGSGHRGSSNGSEVGGLRMNAVLEGQGCLPQSTLGC